MSFLRLQSLSAEYGGTQVLHKVELNVQQGEIVSLLGPSGSGKSTLLRCIAGLHPISGGEITVSGVSMSRSDFLLEPARRKMGMVFQDYALFPHLSVEDNVRFGARGDEQRVQKLLELTELLPVRKRFPGQLSGGQQQRVALARALAPKPELLLLDEPFSNLDQSLREDLAQQLKALVKKEGVTAVFVTHDQDEAFAVGDQVALLDSGQLLQYGSPQELYYRPDSVAVASFVGDSAQLSAGVENGDPESGVVQTALGTVAIDIDQPLEVHDEVVVFVRPEHLQFCDLPSATTAEVVHTRFCRGVQQVDVQLPSGELVTLYNESLTNFEKGAQAQVAFVENARVRAFLKKDQK